MRSLGLVLVTATLMLTACGDGDPSSVDSASKPAAETAQTTSPREIPATTPTPQSKKAPTPSTKEAPAQAEPESCGDVKVDATGGGDQPTNVTAEGIDCASALNLAEAVTVTGADAPVSGFDCPDASTYGATSQICTKGDATVKWTVRFN